MRMAHQLLLALPEELSRSEMSHVRHLKAAVTKSATQHGSRSTWSINSTEGGGVACLTERAPQALKYIVAVFRTTVAGDGVEDIPFYEVDRIT